VHSYRHTRREVKAALGVDIEQLFDDFDAKPLASGSIAQVHKATLKQAPYRQYLQQQHQQPLQQQQEEQEQQVVVKVCHPNVAEHIRMDFKLVGWLSIAASKLPLLKGLPVRESVAQFTHTMTAQADLRVEAVHALRFHNNFAGGAAGTVSAGAAAQGFAVSCS
jgi:aarF domain-containing kinase